MRLLTLTLITLGIAAAQTYTRTTDGVCMVPTSNILPLPQIYLVCPENGSPMLLTDPNGSQVALYFSLHNNTLSIAGVSGTLQVTNYVSPAGCSYRPGVPCTTLGSVAFTWSTSTQSGTYSSSLDYQEFCGGERCWHHPVLPANTQVLTIN